ncbi:CD40 ligand [Pholidichthys leucotaenia]
MINTYQTSVAPPPVPPRLSRAPPFLIPAPLPSGGHSKHVIRFMVGVVLLHLLLSVGGFLALWLRGSPGESFSPQGGQEAIRGDFPSFEKLMNRQERPLARMVVKNTGEKSEPGYLQWVKHHSVRRNINFYLQSWLTIVQPGDYNVYSRVTFSKGNKKLPLVSRVKLRRNETSEEKDVMQAYCSLASSTSPQVCTVTQEEVITLQRGNQLSVWVPDLSLVDYGEGATSFGIYKLL